MTSRLWHLHGRSGTSRDPGEFPVMPRSYRQITVIGDRSVLAEHVARAVLVIASLRCVPQVITITLGR